MPNGILGQSRKQAFDGGNEIGLELTFDSYGCMLRTINNIEYPREY